MGGILFCICAYVCIDGITGLPSIGVFIFDVKPGRLPASSSCTHQSMSTAFSFHKGGGGIVVVVVGGCQQLTQRMLWPGSGAGRQTYVGR